MAQTEKRETASGRQRSCLEAAVDLTAWANVGDVDQLSRIVHGVDESKATDPRDTEAARSGKRLPVETVRLIRDLLEAAGYAVPSTLIQPLRVRKGPGSDLKPVAHELRRRLASSQGIPSPRLS